MRIDAHQHFWRYDPWQYAWIREEMEVLKRDFLPEHLQPELRDFTMDGCVAVQARESLEETHFLLELARQTDFVLGVVGWVDLRSERIEEHLVRLSGERLLVGVRHLVQDEPDDEFMLRDDFQRGIAQLATFGLTYDILTYPRQLPAAIRLVEAFPEQSFVLDHISKPPIGPGGVPAVWERDVRALARYPNVACKVSGMVTESENPAWRPKDFFPYLDVVFDAFGENGVMYGSDWPVCLLASTYKKMSNIVVEYAEQIPERARAKLFGGNAARFYGLEPRAWR